MRVVFIELAKYIFAFFIAFYVAASYYGASSQNENIRKKIYIFQNILMFLSHLLGFLLLYQLNSEDIKYLIFYFAQFIYLFVIIVVYDVLYPKASRLLVNNMCMLLSIGFIMLARLDYNKAVKQFVIAIAGTIVTFFIPWILKKSAVS